jgi:GMP synthase (glutamine-hydrolysing)
MEEKIHAADKIIISGSTRSAYEDFSWKPKLAQAVDMIVASNKPTFAICFGAQYLAHHLGGKVILNPNGTEFGSVTIELTEEGKTHPYLQGFHQEKHVHASHNDRIENLPAETKLLAFNENSPVQAYQYRNIFATQFHPDLPAQNLHNLLEMRKDRYREKGIFTTEEDLQNLKNNLEKGSESYVILERFLDSQI